MNFTQNFPKWHTSLMKAWYGNAATTENDFAYDWLPEADGAYDVLAIFERMHQGKMNGFFCQGFNPLAAVPNKKKVCDGAVQAEVPGGDGSAGDRDQRVLEELRPAQRRRSGQDPDRGVPPADHAASPKETGTFTNSSRVIQWHWKAADGPGEAKDDTEIMARLFLKLQEMYAKDGGTFPDPIVKLTWPYNQPPSRRRRRCCARSTARRWPTCSTRRTRPRCWSRPASSWPASRMLRDDGSTACGNWIYCGCWSQAGNLTARRDNADPSGLGQTLNWGFAWPANRRIIYNRASADQAGKPWDPKRTVLGWNGTAWGGTDVPDMRPDAAPEQNVMPFIMNPEGVARLFSRERWPKARSPSTTSRSRRRWA